MREDTELDEKSEDLTSTSLGHFWWLDVSCLIESQKQTEKHSPKMLRSKKVKQVYFCALSLCAVEEADSGNSRRVTLGAGACLLAGLSSRAAGFPRGPLWASEVLSDSS